MAKIKKFEDIESWKRARKLTKDVYTVTAQDKFQRDFGLKDQIRRAAVSILSNIAEGFERGGDKEFLQFLAIAKGSSGEVRAQLYVALDLEYIVSAIDGLACRAGGKATFRIQKYLQNRLCAEADTGKQRALDFGHWTLDMSETLLEMRNITKSFPGVKALDGVSFDLSQAEVHALVGENGAGKSTLIKILAGVYPHPEYGGKIVLDGLERRFANVRESEHAGIAIIFQELSLVKELSIVENIFLAASRRFGIINWEELYSRAQSCSTKFICN